MLLKCIFRIIIFQVFSFFIAPNGSAQELSKFLCLGDSYTYGESVANGEQFYAQLYDSLNNDDTWVEPITIAQTGWRTDDLFNAISEAKLDYNYDFVTLLIGVNNQYQGRPFSQYEKEFITLLDSSILFAQSDPNHVFVLSIPDYYFTPFGQEQKGEWVSEEIDRYNAYAKSVCDSLHVSFIDITPISRRGIEEPELIANDGLHPSGVQYKLWVEKLLMEMESQQLR
jgi:acyl-CoA thioesterase I